MLVAEAQRKIRNAYLGGFMGQLVSGLLWLSSAALATWGTRHSAILLLVLGGFFIFPLTRLGLLLIRHDVKLSEGNPLNGLALQLAFTLPLALPVVGAAALHRIEWFYPAFMLILGAHYLPFVFLYGMRMFAVLAAALLSAGIVLALYVTLPFSAGAWFTGATLIVFAVIGRSLVTTESRSAIGETAPATAG